MKHSTPGIYVLGATRAMIDREGPFGIIFQEPAVDKKHKRPLWNMPQPKYQVLHFKTLASKTKWMKTRLNAEELITKGMDPGAQQIFAKDLRDILKAATIAVPVYAGITARECQQVRRKQRRIAMMNEADYMNYDFDYEEAHKENGDFKEVIM